ncbi:hypothetical protein HAX54_025831 [Datura stramonium]|uniref:Membrane-associated kinase regulator 4 n=1 Tax=Datura stramonium TaxID=4076 RepID=A0ABS8V287_DATST|nr:hypothetical protein [Datura stramonium]
MARNPLPSTMDHSDDEDYIDIEVSSCSYFSSCPQNREFEFQMASITNNKSPADELFHRGKLLPLHQTESFQEEDLEDSFSINLMITPVGSCRVSFELNPNDHFFELTPSSSIVNHNSPKKLWSKLIKHSLVSHKFKASRAFLKSLLSKSSCTNGNSCSSKDMKVSKKKKPLENTSNGTSCAIKNIEGLSSRSFSAAEIKWHYPTKCLSSSLTNSSSNGGSFSSSNRSFNSNDGFYELNFLKRSSSFTSGIEGSIEAAVAHCKKSQDFTIPTIPKLLCYVIHSPEHMEECYVLHWPRDRLFVTLHGVGQFSP